MITPETADQTTAYVVLSSDEAADCYELAVYLLPTEEN